MVESIKNAKRPTTLSEVKLVVFDDYSRFPVVEALTSISAKSVIPRLDSIFSMFGIPSVCRTDSGSPFNGDDSRQFAIQMGFKHRRVTPLHPRANSHVERFMSPLQKAIKSAVIEGLARNNKNTSCSV